MSPVWIESENIKPSLLIATKMLDNNFPEEFLGKQQYDLPCQIAHDQSGQELSSNDHLSHLKDFAAVKIKQTSRYRRQELSSSQSEKTDQCHSIPPAVPMSHSGQGRELKHLWQEQVSPQQSQTFPNLESTNSQNIAILKL